MKKFRFPLRSVATVRNLAELRARENFSKAVQLFAEAERRLQVIRARLVEYEDSMRAARTVAFRAADQVTFLAALKEETLAATKTEAEISTARQAMEVARQAWLVTRRDVRVIEKLETKARFVHRHDLEREEQAALDDRTCGIVARTLKAVS